MAFHACQNWVSVSVRPRHDLAPELEMPVWFFVIEIVKLPPAIVFSHQDFAEDFRWFTAKWVLVKGTKGTSLFSRGNVVNLNGRRA